MPTTHRPPAIEVRGLRKSFGTQVVLDGLDLTVQPGEIFAVLRFGFHNAVPPAAVASLVNCQLP